MGKYATETYNKYDTELKEKFGTAGFSLDDFQREYSTAMDSAWSKDMAEQHDESVDISIVQPIQIDQEVIEKTKPYIAEDKNGNRFKVFPNQVPNLVIFPLDENGNAAKDNVNASTNGFIIVNQPSPIADMADCPIMVPSRPIPVQHIPAPPVAPPVAPLHRVDEPAKQPPAVSDVDNVVVNIATEPVPVAPAPNKPVLPEVIKPLAPADPVDTTAVVSKIDNSAVISKFHYMKFIEDIANQKGYQIAMSELTGVDGRPLGLISVTSYSDSSPNPEPDISRCFTIDDGNIIDHRAKLFSFAPLAVANGLVIEDCPCWALTVQWQKGSILNYKLLTTIFSGGMESIDDRFLFNPDYAALNKKVALITLPTIGLKKPGRNALQTRLVNMDKAKVFDTAIASAPGSRFRFVEDRLDENDLSKFTLSNVGVPTYYGGPVLNTKQVLIVSTNGKVEIKD